jgi:hypothetical protein
VCVCVYGCSKLLVGTGLWMYYDYQFYGLSFFIFGSGEPIIWFQAVPWISKNHEDGKEANA